MNIEDKEIFNELFARTERDFQTSPVDNVTTALNRNSRLRAVILASIMLLLILLMNQDRTLFQEAVQGGISSIESLIASLELVLADILS